MSISLVASSSAEAQQIPVWKIVDATANRTYVRAGIDHAGSASIVALSNGQGNSRLAYRSSDKGVTWSEILSIPPGNSRASFKAVANPVENLIAVAGDSTQFIQYDEFFNAKEKYWGTLTVSRDGGETWEHHLLDSNSRLLDVSMCDGTHGIGSLQTIGNVNYETATAQPDQLLFTDDAWKTWESIPLPDGFSYVPDAICLSPTTFLISGYDVSISKTVMMRTTDRGITWMPVEGFRQELARFSFLDSLNGWGAGGVRTGIGDAQTNLVARTTDGGSTWTTLLNDTISRLKVGIEGIDFADKLNGIAVGTGNTVLRTTDGGITWRQEFAPSDLIFGGLSLVVFPEPDLALSFSQLGPIIRYTGETGLAAPRFIKPEKSGPLSVDSVLVEWSAVDGAIKYRVEVTPDPIGDGFPSSSPPLPSVVDSILEGRSLMLRDLMYWHRYFVRVKAIGAASESDWSYYTGSSLFYTIEQEAILPPTILTPAESSVDVPPDVVVSWQSIPGALSYDLQLGYDQYFISGLALDEAGLTDTAFHVTALMPGTTYFVRVRAHLASVTTDWTSRYAPYAFKTDLESGVHEFSESGRGADGSLALSPNPARDRLTISLRREPGGGAYRIALYNERGELLRTVDESGGGSNAVLSIPDLPQGIYLVRVDDKDGTIGVGSFAVIR